MQTKLTFLEDSELVALSFSGHSNALGILFKRHLETIRNLFFYKIKNGETTDDLVQDLYIRVHTAFKAKKYCEKNNFKAWICTIARNMTTDYFRKERKKPYINISELYQDSTILEETTTKSEDKNKEEVLIFSEDKQMTQKLIELLPKNQREVVILRMYAGLSFKEIANLTNCSINTALGRMRYGLINLRKFVA